MRSGRVVKAAALALSITGTIAFVGMQLASTRVQAEDDHESEASQIAIGLRIAPSFLKVEKKDRALIGLGSYIVNAQADCNGCHTSDPANEYLGSNNPYFLTPPSTGPAAYNPATYLAGGQSFGAVGPGIVQDTSSPLYVAPGLGPAIISRNLTPDYTGNPEGGNDLETFMNIMRTGHDFDTLHLNCGGDVTDNCYLPPVNGAVLQVMPWPLYRHMTDRQLTAIWTYLSAVPCNAHNDTLGTWYPWLKNKCE
ncbi:MAG TPA: hypothetical protein VKR52_14295 [Terracidiphilus sp.]|nr:hypothetical protein [Terracidiphilus sp.]